MWITEERAQSGPVFGSRGELHDHIQIPVKPDPLRRHRADQMRADNFTGVGLFFDT